MFTALAAKYIGPVDIAVFLAFIAAVIGIGLWKSRGEKTHSAEGASDYFLAGRGLTWWLIGFSLIAANISTEQFVGMSGKAADWLGMAIASYEWMAAVTLVVVAFVFLPTFLRSGIYTIPEFLQYRYNTFARTVMAIATLIILVGVPTASVIYSGAKVITVNFQGMEVLGLDLGSITVGCWIIGLLAAVYVFVGGLKACAWADLLQGSALILGGVVILVFAMNVMGDADPEKLIETARNEQVTVESLQGAGPLSRFYQLNQGDLPDGKLHMVREKEDPEIPWTVLIIGLWIPNFFYWGLNQYITQRTLGSKSLAEGQKGVVFSAFLKLLIPFVVVIPGILAFNLYSEDLQDMAVVKNAKTIAAYAPDLYEALSDDVKPDPQDSYVRNDLKAIEKRLEKARQNPPKAIPLFKFSEQFARSRPADATRIIQHNAQKIGKEMPPSDTFESVDLQATNNQLLDELNGTAMKAQTHTLALRDYDAAFPTLIRRLLPVGNGLKGFVLAAIFGAVISSLASMLNSASTIATMDLYNKVKKNAKPFELVSVGRVFVVLFVLIAIFIAPKLDDPAFGGIFTFIQEFQGFISPGILTIFLFGLLIHRVPRYCGTVGLLLNPILYGLFKFSPKLLGKDNPGFLEAVAQWSFLDRMALCFGIIVAVLTILTLINPLKKPVELPVNPKMDMTQSKGALVFGIGVCVLTVALYLIFW